MAYELPSERRCKYVACQHLNKVVVPQPSTLSTEDACRQCGIGAHLWICMTCQRIFCGRQMNGHAGSHFGDNSHALFCSLTLTDLTVWCHACQGFVTNHPNIDRYRMVVMKRWMTKRQATERRVEEEESPVIMNRALPEEEFATQEEEVAQQLQQSANADSTQAQLKRLEQQMAQLMAQLAAKNGAENEAKPVAAATQQGFNIADYLDCGTVHAQIVGALDRRYIYDYRNTSPHNRQRETTVNGVRFLPPHGCLRFGVKAAGQYENDNWLTNTTDNAWPTAFHGTSIEVIRIILTTKEYKTGVRDILRNLDGKIGFWASSDPQESLKYSSSYKAKNSFFKAVLQVRLRPGSYVENTVNGGATYNYRLADPQGNVRTVALCIFRVGDVGPDGEMIGHEKTI